MEYEKRLIDRNEIFPNGTFFASAENPLKSLDDLITRIWSIPTVDAVEVVRCKDCKHLNVLNRKDLYAHCPKTNTVFLPFELDTRTHYCSLGERKDNG